MTKEQFLEKYGKDKTAVHCKTKELAKEFLSLCEEFKIDWSSGDKALSNLEHYWENYIYRTCFNVNDGDCLNFDSVEGYERDGYSLIPFEPEQKTKYPVEKILEMLPVKVKVNEYFRIRGFGDELFYFDKRLKLCCTNKHVKYDIYIGDFINGKYTIEKLPTKPRLTKEEKAFLKGFEFEKVGLVTNLWTDEANLLFDVTDCMNRVLMLDFIKHRFNGLEKGKKYSREELGL